MTDQETNFELLLKDIRCDQSLNITDRNNDFACSTLAYFNQCNKGAADHELWRECYMHEEMLRILIERYRSLNPHLQRLAKFKTNASLREQMIYQQEVGDDGLSELRRDMREKTRYPNLDRERLELLAAENYIFNKWGARAVSSVLTLDADAASQKEAVANTNPILSWREFVKELKPLSISADALNQAVIRCVRKNFGKNNPPWRLGACGEGYLIVGIEETFKVKKNHPTPAVCKYQKIEQEQRINQQSSTSHRTDANRSRSI